MDVSAQGSSFVDSDGRRITLRGVNLGGSSKFPTTPDGRTHLAEGFFDTAASVSFVGRPFSLEEADVHLRRLRAWGVNALRLIITWEAVEHAGPGLYDDAYVKYLVHVVSRARHFGMVVYVDPHQDVWSRFSGGDGAPLWTFEKVGLDARAFQETGAALVHQTWGGKGTDKSQFPRMAWPTNLHKLACATMFTLFWAGDKFAPTLRIDGEPVQAYLQNHYVRAMAYVAEALRRLPNVIGFGTMNEPLPGYVGIPSLARLSGPLKNDLMPTPFEGMALGAGHPTKVGVYAIDSLRSLAAGLPVDTKLVNSHGRSAWLPGHECVWKRHGVWDVDPRTNRPRLLKPDYFAKVDFGRECYIPFASTYAQAVRAAGNPEWLIFLEMPPADLGLAAFPKMDVKTMGGGMVHAPHWYDQLTLFLGKFVPWASLDVQTGTPALGEAAVSRLRAHQLKEMVDQAATHVGGAPTLIGEVGIPFDMHAREAYAEGARRTLTNCSNALSATVNALEANNLSYTLWCYAPDHTPEWGDGWNREDLSLYSMSAAREVAKDLDPYGVHAGGRALSAWVRPYAQALGGDATRPPHFDPETRHYELIYKHDPTLHEHATTDIFVPVPVQYPDGFDVLLSDGSFEVEQHTTREGGHAIVHYHPDRAHETHTIRLQPKQHASPKAGSVKRAVSSRSLQTESTLASWLCCCCPLEESRNTDLDLKRQESQVPLRGHAGDEPTDAASEPSSGSGYLGPTREKATTNQQRQTLDGTDPRIISRV